jgi:hypothetical protein
MPGGISRVKSSCEFCASCSSFLQSAAEFEGNQEARDVCAREMSVREGTPFQRFMSTIVYY